MNILILNGPNLNLLGEREPEIYGNQSFEDYLLDLKSMFPKVEIEYFQSNMEGELINKLHENRNKIEGIIFIVFRSSSILRLISFIYFA